jgi:hypothetical protein
MICTRKGCHNDAGDFKTCDSCRAKQRAANDRFFGRKPDGKHKCKTEKCKITVEGRAQYCKPCIKARLKAQKSASCKSARAEVREVKAAKEPKPSAPAQTLTEAIAEAMHMRERRDRLNPDLLNQRLLRGAFR